MKTVPERLATLEERVQNMLDQGKIVSERVDEIYTLIQRGKGAKWVILTVASAISAGLGIISHKLLPF